MILKYIKFWRIYFRYFCESEVTLEEILEASLDYPGDSSTIYKFLTKVILDYEYSLDNLDSDDFGNLDSGKLVLGRSLWNSKLDKKTKNIIRILNKIKDKEN